ncbi:MAG: type II secretion system protein GspJ, partial [Pirellulales bacterium]|nr:type II secretion system protein GspJ [Pirellulales bacterium]
DVAQAQLARAILRQMADDLRGAIWYEPLDVSSALSGLAGAAGGASASLGSSPDNAAGSGAGQAGTTGDSSGAGRQLADQAAAAEAASVSDSSIYPPEPGLYGGSDWLEVDVSRLPRLLPGALNSVGEDLPSEVKTISWYLAGGTSTAGQSAVTAEGEPLAGLMRRELDRAVTQWASETGQLGDLNRQAQLVAAEVVDLAFRYFDGTTWVNQWDSASAGGLPWAVEIRLTLAEPGAAARGDVRLSAAETTYRLVVALPLAEAASAEASAASGEEGAEPTSSDEGGQAGASAGGGTSSGGASGGSATGGGTGISGSGGGR